VIGRDRPVSRPSVPLRTSLALIALPLALAGCPKKGGSNLLVGIQPKPGYECREVRVGVNETDVETHTVGCSTTVWFENDEASVEVPMPIPSDRSGPVMKQWTSSSPPTRRHVQIRAPGLRDEDWMVDVEAAVVGAEGLSSGQITTFELAAHRYVVFVLKEQTESGTVFSVPFETGTRIQSLYREDKFYCTEYANVVKVYVADESTPANRRTFLPEGAIQDVPVYCSRTDDHVFAIDLKDREENVFDIVVESALRLPRIFRLTMEADANYTVVDITLQRQT